MADARAEAAAGTGVTAGRRVPRVHPGQGKAAWSERQATEVEDITGLTTYEQCRAPQHRGHHNHRDFQPNPINAVVLLKWNNRDYGSGSKTVFVTNASVQRTPPPFDSSDDRSLIENCCIKRSKQQWSLDHPPQRTARTVRAHVMFTFLTFATTPYRWQRKQAEARDAPVGWQRWRRQRLGLIRDEVIFIAQGAHGIFHMAGYSLLLRTRLKSLPPSVGPPASLREIWAHNPWLIRMLKF